MASGDVNRIRDRFRQQVDFLLIYLREAHPKDGNATNEWSKIISDPRSQAERNAVATSCGEILKFNFPIVVDTLDDTTAIDYAAWPERIYVVDEQGDIAYAGYQGPWGFWPSHRSIKRREDMLTGKPIRQDTLEVFLERRYLAEQEPFEAE